MNWNKITIHHSASRDVSANTIRRWHLKRGFSDIGYHFVIGKNGKLESGRPLTKTGEHVKGKNRRNVGVCLTGNFQKHHPTKKQFSTLRTFSLCSNTLTKSRLTRSFFTKTLPQPCAQAKTLKSQYLLKSNLFKNI